MLHSDVDRQALELFHAALDARELETTNDRDGDYVDGHASEVVAALLTAGWRPPVLAADELRTRERCEHWIDGREGERVPVPVPGCRYCSTTEAHPLAGELRTGSTGTRIEITPDNGPAFVMPPTPTCETCGAQLRQRAVVSFAPRGRYVRRDPGPWYCPNGHPIGQIAP